MSFLLFTVGRHGRCFVVQERQPLPAVPPSFTKSHVFLGVESSFPFDFIGRRIPPHLLRGYDKIGRASCRERVF